MSAQRRLANITSHFGVAAPAPAAVAANQTGFQAKPLKVVVTGAAGNIAYAALFMIGQGKMLGPNQPIELCLLDIPPAADAMEGVRMELQDAAFPLVTKLTSTTDYATAFSGVDIALLIGARPRGPGMDRKDLLKANGKIFEGQGKALNQYASPNVKILVVGNPCNTNALIGKTYSPSLPANAWTAMTRLDQLRATGQIAQRLGVTSAQVKNIIIWGNHSKTQYPDVNHGYIADYPSAGMRTSIRDAVKDDAWLNGEFIKTVQMRGAAIIKARKKSSAASAANAAIETIRTWFEGTAPGEIVNVAIPSDGSYGVPQGLIFSFPVTHNAGSYQIVQGLKLDAFSKAKIKATTDELLAEKAAALGGN